MVDVFPNNSNRFGDLYHPMVKLGLTMRYPLVTSQFANWYRWPKKISLIYDDLSSLNMVIFHTSINYQNPEISLAFYGYFTHRTYGYSTHKTDIQDATDEILALGSSATTGALFSGGNEGIIRHPGAGWFSWGI